MSISIYSVLFSVLISGILLFCMILFCKQCENMGKTELITAIMIGMLCFCRILFPVDLRSSYAIRFKGLYADLCSTMMKNVIFLGRKYEVWHGIALSTGVVAFIKIVKFLLEYRSTLRYISKMERYPEEELEPIVSVETLHKKKYDIRMSGDITIPCGIGLLHKYIIFPCRKYSADELHYILMHEIQHFKEGDLLIKFLTEMICCILWWNPLFRKVQELISHGIEVRCDTQITSQLSAEEKSQYMMTLVHVVQNKKNEKSMKSMAMTSLGDTSTERLKERISILCNKTGKKENKHKVIAITAGLIFLLSYCILPVAQYSAPISEIEEDGAQDLDLQNCMLLYVDGKYELLDENGNFICEYAEDSGIVKKLQVLIKN